jgi:hypothetical protein
VRWRRLTPLAVAAALLLAGCSSSADLDPDAAHDLRAVAYSVAELSAAGDPAGALAALAELESELQVAQADGAVSADKARSVQAVIDLVRADLDPPAVETPFPPTPETAPPVITEIVPPETDVPVETTPVETVDSPAETVDSVDSPAEPVDSGAGDNKGNGNGTGGDKGNNGKGNGKKP